MENEDGSNFIVISPRTMREPTNLELAQLLALQSSLINAMTSYFMLAHDLLSDEALVEEASDTVSQLSEMIAVFWESLLLEEEEKADHGND